VFAGLTRAHSRRRHLRRRGTLRHREGRGLRKSAPGVVYPDRRPPGIAHPLAEATSPSELSRLAPSAVRSCSMPADQPVRLPTSRVRRFRGRTQSARPGHPDPWRKRPGTRIRPFRAVVHHPPDAHRPVSRKWYSTSSPRRRSPSAVVLGVVRREGKQRDGEQDAV